MTVTIKLFANFRVGRFASAAREYPPRTTAGDILRELRIPDNTLGPILVNGQQVNKENQLREGDILSVFPHEDWSYCPVRIQAGPQL